MTVFSPAPSRLRLDKPGAGPYRPPISRNRSAHLEEHYGALAHHYGRSGNTDKAVEYLELAGRQAVARSANSEAIGHFTEPDQPSVTFNLDDRSHEPPPVAAVRMPQRSLERDRDRGRADVSDLHG